MKAIVVRNKKDWLASWMADEKRFRGLQVIEDERMDEGVFRVEEVDDEGK